MRKLNSDTFITIKSRRRYDKVTLYLSERVLGKSKPIVGIEMTKHEALILATRLRYHVEGMEYKEKSQG